MAFEVQRAATFGCMTIDRFDAIDPGTDYYGRAHFCGGDLHEVEYKHDLLIFGAHSIKGVIEKPVVYPHQTRNARAVAALAFSAGELLGQYNVRYRVEPRTWKGTMEGGAFLRRVKRLAQQRGDWPLIERCLRDVKADLWEHPLDAYALGLWCLGVEI